MFHAAIRHRKQGSSKKGLPFFVAVLLLCLGSIVFTQGSQAQYTQLDQVVRQVSQLRGELAYLAGELQRAKNGDTKAIDLNAMALRVSAAEAQIALVKSKADRLAQQINTMQASMVAQGQKTAALEGRMLTLEQNSLASKETLSSFKQSIDVQRDVLKQGLLRLGSTASVPTALADPALIPSLTGPNGQAAGQSNGLLVETSEFPEQSLAALDLAEADFDDEDALRAFMQGGEAAFDPYQDPSPVAPEDLVQGTLVDFADTDANPQTKDAAYQAALADFRAGAFVSAQNQFQEFLKTYESDTLAGNASYWLGESFYGEGDYTRAALQFSKGYATYRESPKAPDHLLKLGLSLEKLNRTQEACASLLLLQQNAPADRVNLTQKVEQELQRLSCA